MKVVIYNDNAEEQNIIAAAVTAYSIQKKGRLSAETEYILYTWEAEKAKENKLVKYVFNRIEIPPIGDFWEKTPKWQKSKFNKRKRECWTKFLCWIKTPTEGEPVAVIDNDILCLGSIKEAIPEKGKLFSARRGFVKGQLAMGCNGGFLIKSPEFDESDAPAIMTHPLLLGNAWCQTKRIWPWSDEMGPVWFFIKRGFEKFQNMETKYNQIAQWLINSGQTIEQADVRMLHFMGKNKPWKKVKPELMALKERWIETKRELERRVSENECQLR